MPAGACAAKRIKIGDRMPVVIFETFGGSKMTNSLIYELPDGTSRSYSAGTGFSEMVKDLQPLYISPIVAVKLNHEIRDLYHIPTVGGKLVSDRSEPGRWRSYLFSKFIIGDATGTEELFPGCKVRFEHSLSKGIYGEIYLQDLQPFTEKELRQVAARMRQSLRLMNRLPKKHCRWIKR